ncbi:MAG: hypothetical protein H6635_00100 [Anaerolineales bacterium]|nr:hypothetical protein [Bacteroidota bacterium]MCB9143741.1 hypothetical protein [Anaerolineales bacterium]
MLSKIPQDCPNCHEPAKTYLYVIENDLGLTKTVKCKNCGWFDEMKTELGGGVETARNIAIGAGVIATVWKIFNDLNKPKS